MRLLPPARTLSALSLVAVATMGVRQALLASVPLLCAAWQWDQPTTSGNSAGERRGHTVTLFTTAGTDPLVVVCGGEDATLFATNACNVLSPFGWVWKTSFSLAGARTDHVALQVQSSGEGYLVVVGGTTSTALACESVLGKTWEVTTTPCEGTLPAATWGASLVTTSKGVNVFFGGATGSAAQPGADVATTLTLDGTQAPFRVVFANPPMTADPPPAARHYHGCAAWGSRVLIHGGVTTVGEVLGDLWMLETDSTSWVWVQLQAIADAPRIYGHRALTIDSTLILFGGSNPQGSMLYSGAVSLTGVWTPVAPAAGGSAPTAVLRAACALLDADGDSDPDLVVYGGSRTASTGPTATLFVLSDIGKNAPEYTLELPWIIGGGVGAAALLGGLALCAWRRKSKPAGFNAMLAAMSNKPYDAGSMADDEEEDALMRQPFQASAVSVGGALGVQRQPSSARKADLTRTPSRASSAYGKGLLGREASSAKQVALQDREGGEEKDADEEDDEEERATEARLRF